ncbi:hypothetical protein HWD72_13435 [Enterococcus hirae]|uniref:hypothetical protein n=2 Tax=Enterococcus hirae TaxID=1354 RepID=UPI001177F9AC|nr:hypothetical protein [Enterococcus hirae]EMF0102673.1 hypothetical protein [Enterococcus hirae]EMF0124824.1 hypothetical protein [Enterococcus hirae]EMF0574802.1 hypothetical protein [Enterococcus hirae]MBA5252501.1 hypothetical protein [Enterococcus hirae]MCA6767174.1 hypothetical protein [Enterococcus hirae]
MLKTKKNSYKLKLSILSIICLVGMIISGHLYRVAYTQFIEFKVHSLGLAGDRYVEYVHYSLKCSSYILLWLIFSLFELLNLIAISSYHLDKLNTKSSRYNEVFKENMKLESDLNKLKKIKRRKHKLTKIILLRMMEYKDTNITIITSLIGYGLLSISILSIDYGVTILQVLVLAIPMYLSLFIMHEIYMLFVLSKNVEIRVNILVNSYQKELKERRRWRYLLKG